ncbi:MAG: hypothetical protein KAS86_04720, partial [Candidatus Omnitrophica bacterium]|nr:hypothetical protein [Candidatus Omnitrophota bacterium]
MKRICLCMVLVVSACFARTEMLPAENDLFAVMRRQMVDRQLKKRGITDNSVLKAMTRVERHLFVPQNLRDEAYRDSPLPIGYDQTISQP